MLMIDTRCPACGDIKRDVLLREKNADSNYVFPTCKCGTITTRVFDQTAAHVIQDSIPGGMWIRNGICNDDGTPRRYDSFSEMRTTAKQKKMVNYVVHQGRPGSDKSKHTQLFTSIPLDEATRLRNWHEHEAQFQKTQQARRPA